MPQLNMFHDRATPFSLSIDLTCDPRFPENGLDLTVIVFDVDGKAIGRRKWSLVGLMVDYADEIAKAAVLGYLYGDTWNAAMRSADSVVVESRHHAHAHRNEGFSE